MKRFAVCFFAFIGILACGGRAEAQLIERAEQLVKTALHGAEGDTLQGVLSV